MATQDPTRSLAQVVDRLVSYEPAAQPVLSLYLDTRADQHGRDNYEPFLRKAISERARGLAADSPERAAYEADAERIQAWLRAELSPSSDGVAVFACGEAGLFEAAELDVPVGESGLYVSPRPHVWPLVQLIEQYPRYAALVADTSLARLFVFGMSTRVREERVESPRTNRTTVGGWSQMRYQRHIDDQYRKHAKEVVGTLERVVRDERIDHVILAGDAVIVPKLREQLSQELSAKILDVVPLDIRTPEREVLESTLEVLRRKDAESDEERVRELVDAYRAGGLAVVGVPACLGALEIGQVHELVMAADPSALRGEGAGEAAPEAAGTATVPAEASAEGESLADTLVRLAHQSGASVKVIEDARLLAPWGGAVAALRYRLDRSAGNVAEGSAS